MSAKRILIAVGGTGGHIFPALGFAQELRNEIDPPSVLFAGGGLAANPFFDRSLFPYKQISAAPLSGKNLIKCLKNVMALSQGVWQSIWLLKEFRPDVVVGFGSFYTMPLLTAARLLKVPIILHEANSIPGKANKFFAPSAWRIGIHFPSTASLLKGKTVEVGMPMRSGYKLNQISKEEALGYFELESQKTVLLVFGGSQGAKGINAIMKLAAIKWQNGAFQIIHFTGNQESAEEFKELYATHHIKACVKPFENQMHLAWRASDLFIGRAGASTIAEAMEFEVPGILIPYPYATDGHQDKNADFLVDIVGGGIKLAENEFNETLPNQWASLLASPEKLNQFKNGMRKYKKRPDRKNLSQLVLNFCNKGVEHV
ncbi:MAG: undecaprenyldiphospho-muramoylpentapeptide beta-N-acetylglucosaminyltransferase [Candidatus Protochlamydia sp.]|nr:undecaprenyldiphospho-muramoylpentapeptide beta-N-acetylglucosaminyltransferase [Candidatus Protochlamydia sp.]